MSEPAFDHPNEEAAYNALRDLTPEQIAKVIAFMEDGGAIADLFYLMKLQAARLFALDLTSKDIHRFILVMNEASLEIDIRYLPSEQQAKPVRA